MSLGVIGGLGPMATACFLELLTSMTDASCDQEHIETIIYSKPSIPDRTAFILGESPADPVPEIISIARKLEAEGVDAIAVPCVTASYFRDRIGEVIKTPMFHGVDRSVSAMKERGIRNVGLMATSGTIRTGILSDAFSREGITATVPGEGYQAKVMSLIYDYVKKGIAPDLTLLYDVYEHLMSRGAECVLFGCTELSVINMRYDIKGDFFDILEMLAEESITAAGGRVKRKDIHN